MKRHQQLWDFMAAPNPPQEPETALQQLVEEYPYFSAAHLLLAAHHAGNSNGLAYAQKAALHVPNSFWLQYQLATTETTPLLDAVTEQADVVATETLQAKAPVPEPAMQQPAATLPVQATNLNSDEPMTASELAEQFYAADNTVTTDNPLAAEIPDSIQLHLEGNVKDEPEELSPEEDLNAVSAEAEAATANKLSSILDEQLADFAKPVTAETELPISTEPYHTIDYFASQGIKADHLTTPQDNLSRKLRKFTDWLKQMKHEKPDTDDLGTDPELETAIQDIAGNSNEAREIVTVTMAEVLEKQGKYDKAIQLYIKLSFLNPDKSAYFASKIQQLKGI